VRDGIFCWGLLFKPVGNPSMLHVNLESRLAVQGSDERPKPEGDARRCDG
jgi:hypothetical protein